MGTVSIQNRKIGDAHPAFIIAEMGINHNGDVALAKEMIAAAWESGADAVKLQSFITDKFLHPTHPGYQYDIDAEIPHHQEEELWDFAMEKGICLFSTPEEFTSLEFIKKQNPPLIKIAAMDFNYQELIVRAAGIGKPIILSAGMSNMDEVLQAVRWVEEAGNRDYIVLHCVSCYPAQADACNLAAIQTMKQALDCPVGFSDHTVGTHIPLAAVALGANLIEKHFTLDHKLPGPDQTASMDPDELRSLVGNIRDLERAIGDGIKRPAAVEAEPRRFKRRGIYAAVDIEPGRRIRHEDVLFYAPSLPRSRVTDWPRMEGRPVTRSIGRMECVTLDDID